jgi:two-component system response regulator AtoC
VNINVRSLTTLFDKPIDGPPAVFHLLILGPDLFMNQPLPKAGSLTIGRADNADIRITDPLASRLHARLHLGEGGTIEIEDIGSINRTKVRDVDLQHGERVAVLPGEAVTIGSTILMVQETRTAPRPRRVWPHTYFEARLEEECTRAAELRTPFAMMRLSVSGSPAAGAVADGITAALRATDMLALYGRDEYELLLPATLPEMGAALGRDLMQRLNDRGIAARTGLGCYPRDGQSPEALVAAASERLRGSSAAVVTDGLVVEDPRMRRVYSLAQSAARGTISVLLLGETGVGKDKMAEEIHRMSPRAKAPFVSFNCGALAENLLASELFGHEKGAFTGASDAKPGLLETAPGGTVFLDEIGDLPMSLQVHLLRVLETRMITRVGSLKPRPIDVRFISATNRDLEAEIASGRFRRDLFFRINGIAIQIPPLRERRGEIVTLARMFLASFARRDNRPAPELSAEVAHLCEAYPWPGNVREVRNVMERALLLCDGPEILVEHLSLETMAANSINFASSAPAVFPGGAPVPPSTFAGPDEERDRILRVMAEHGGNQSRAAKALGIARSTLISRLESYGVPRPRKALED